MFKNKIYIDEGVNPTVSIEGSNISINYTKGGGAHLAVASLTSSPLAIKLRGQNGYCKQAVPFGSSWLRLYGQMVEIQED